MKARFFYAPPIFNTFPKLYVLTSDGELYSEIRKDGKLSMELQPADFNSFEEARHTTDDYPMLLEVDFDEAARMPLKDQPNWVSSYVDSKNIMIEQPVAISA